MFRYQTLNTSVENDKAGISTFQNFLSLHNQEILDDIIKGYIPKTCPRLFDLAHNKVSTANRLRDIICYDNGMWLYLYEEYVQNLFNWLTGRSILDPFAGRGWLAKGLSDLGTDVEASDYDLTRWFDNDNLVFDVKEMFAINAASTSNKDVMILSWVPYNLDVSDVCEAWGKDRTILFIGELGECCSTYEFSETVRKFKSFKNENDLDPWQWPYIHDYSYSFLWGDSI